MFCLCLFATKVGQEACRHNKSAAQQHKDDNEHRGGKEGIRSEDVHPST